MQSFSELTGTIVNELGICLSAVSADQVALAIHAIESSERVFVAGAGRSGLAMRALGMRLMHLGKTVFVVGEVTTPAIARDDLLVIGSGSGSTGSLQIIAGRAQSAGARILLITIVPNSPIGQLSNFVIRVPAPSPKAEVTMGTVDSIQPMGSLFEQTLFLLGDALVMSLMGEHGIDSDVMFTRHANLE